MLIDWENPINRICYECCYKSAKITVYNSFCKFCNFRNSRAIKIVAKLMQINLKSL